MVVAEGTRAPMESLLFTDQCVYLSRKHPLWGRQGSVSPGEVVFPDQSFASEKTGQVQDSQDFGWTQVSVGLGPFGNLLRRLIISFPCFHFKPRFLKPFSFF